MELRNFASEADAAEPSASGSADDFNGPRKCPALPSGLSKELSKALRQLYEDADGLERRPWLLQPVRGSANRGFSSGRVGAMGQSGSGVARQRPSSVRRPASARQARMEEPSDAALPSASSTVTTSGPAPVLTARSTPSRVGSVPPAPRRPRPGSAPPCRGPNITQNEVGQFHAAARQVKQEKLRTWFCRKDAESAARRHAESLEAGRTAAEERLVEQRKQKQQVYLQQRREARLGAAARRQMELDMLVYEAAGRSNTVLGSAVAALTGDGGERFRSASCRRATDDCSNLFDTPRKATIAAYASSRPTSARPRSSGKHLNSVGHVGAQTARVPLTLTSDLSGTAVTKS